MARLRHLSGENLSGNLTESLTTPLGCFTFCEANKEALLTFIPAASCSALLLDRIKSKLSHGEVLFISSYQLTFINDCGCCN